MLKSLIQRVLGSTGYQLQKIRAEAPRLHIDVFSLCMNDLLRKISYPFVLQIGANDGVRADPVRPFIATHKLDALLVEPHPKMFEILESNYSGYSNVRLENAAISDAGQSFLSLYAPDQRLLSTNQKLSGLCSLSKDQLLKELAREGVAEPAARISETRVPAMSVSQLLKKHCIDRLDVLQIDVEGFDWRVLSQFSLDALGVKLINMEFFHLTPDEKVSCLDRLMSLGYETAFVLGDLVAYRRSS